MRVGGEPLFFEDLSDADSDTSSEGSEMGDDYGFDLDDHLEEPPLKRARCDLETSRGLKIRGSPRAKSPFPNGKSEKELLSIIVNY